MTQPYRSSSAASLIVLASMMAGCAAHQSHVAAASAVGGKVDPEAGLGMRALAALNANDVPSAIDLAQRAVEKTPTDAGFRALLGNAYFAGGRFHSAEQAYKDCLTIDANQPQVVLKLALVEIAQGKNGEAVATLSAGHSILDTSDYGLALALAGHPAHAVSVLQAAARQQGADATVRQNLALAYALAGDWDNARLIASQDVPGGQLDDRIHQWMQFAKPAHASDQVAALVGVKPAAVDVGQPVQLALNKEEAPAVNVAAVAAPQKPVKPNIVVEAAVPAAQVQAPVAAVAPAPPPPRATIATIAESAVAEAKSVIASFTHTAPIAAKPAVARREAAAAPRRGNSPAVVQLGAYGSAERVLAAWNGQAHKYGALKAYLPMSARFSSPKGTFYRLAVKGFNSVGEANALCSALKRQGGSCFVRNVAGDTPVQYASR